MALYCLHRGGPRRPPSLPPSPSTGWGSEPRPRLGGKAGFGRGQVMGSAWIGRGSKEGPVWGERSLLRGPTGSPGWGHLCPMPSVVSTNRPGVLMAGTSVLGSVSSSSPCPHVIAYLNYFVCPSLYFSVCLPVCFPSLPVSVSLLLSASGPLPTPILLSLSPCLSLLAPTCLPLWSLSCSSKCCGLSVLDAGLLVFLLES